MAIGVSESSLRRWVDSGEIETFRTKGGHRRIPVAAAMRFIRQSGSAIVRPDLLDLESGDTHQELPQRLFEAMRAGDRHKAAGLVMSLFMAGESIASICDGPLRDVMHQVGDLWHHSRLGIMHEHRATELCAQLLHDFRTALATVPSHAPVALGGAAEADVYTLPSAMVDLVLTDLGFKTVNFGARTPADLLADVAEEMDASLVWLSVSVDLPKERHRGELQRLARRLHDQGRALVIGGRHSHDINLGRMANVIMASSMRHLADVAQGMQLARRKV